MNFSFQDHCFPLRTYLLSFICTLSIHGFAQRSIKASDTIRITGIIKNEMYFALKDLDTFKTWPVKDQIIYNHKGEVKDTITGIRGIPLKEILQPVEYIYEKPKTLNEFYFVMVATDGYKVVLSWNEIYNTETGNQFFIITEMDGKHLRQMEQRIVFLSAGDLKAGRRYIKGLQQIIVKQVN